MGIALPQLAPASEDRVSGAQVVDGSLKFDGSTAGGVHGFGHLRRTSSGAGGGGTFTISWWAKRGSMRGDWQYMIAGDNGSLWGVGFVGTGSPLDALTLFNGSHQYTSARFRDNSGWYHIVLVVNSVSGSKLWVNGVAQSNTNTNSSYNLNNTMYIGKWVDGGTAHNYDGYLAQYTCIDGLELGPSYFGYTDPLTGTWRPKKFVAEGTTVNDGTDWGAATMSGAGTVNNKSNIFDGAIGTAGGSTGANTNLTFTLPKSIRVKKSVRIYANQNGTAKINNESAVTTTSGGAKWITIFDGETDFTSFTLTSTGGDTCDIRAVEVDGVMLKSSTTQNLAFGNAGFYLPLDGNTPIGEDLSGNNNHWKPQGFGGSVALDNPTVSGARPILNTGTGGNVARPGVFGSEAGAHYVTTSASNSGGKYYFSHDASAQPTFSFIRGATYTFDWSASSGHPLRFATAADAAGSTEYTDGTNVSGNVTKITVPHNAPDTLYYYCNVHNGMGNSISVTTDETKADPYAWKCVLAMPLVGGNTDVCDQINCTTTAKTLAVQGNATASSAQSNFYNGSFYFDGNGDYLGATTHADFAMGTGDFTLECWVYKSSSAAFMNFMATRGGPGTTAGFTFGSQSSGNGYDIEFYTNALQLNGGNQWVTDNRWHHVAVTRTGTTLRSYVNGILNTTATNSQDFTNTSLAIGITNDASQAPLHGYLQDVRIYKGVAKYTGGTVDNQVFIIPATEPNFLPDSPSGVATKSKLEKITDGAVVFDGTDDEVNVSSHSDLAFGTGNFTIDCFAYFNSFDDTYPTVLSKLVGGDLSWIVRVKNNGKLVWYSKNGSGTNNESSTSPITLKKWHHIAIVREGTGSNQLKGYVDGKVALTMTDSNDYNDSNALCIGTQEAGGGNTINGFISNVRLVKGTAVYTSEFTPPTRTLTNVTNTKLLCCQSNTEPGAAAVAPNVTGINNGTQWSHYLTGAGGFQSSYPASKAFNGTASASETSRSTNSGETQTFAPPVGIPYSSKVEVWTYYTGNVSLNGGSNVAVSDDQDWKTIATGSGTLNTLDFICNSGNNMYLAGIRIDSTTILVDPASPNADAVATTFNPFNTDINTVRGQEGIYATLNAKDYRSFSNGPNYFIYNGGLTAYMTAGNSNASKDRGLVASTMDLPSGKKWYCEITVENVTNNDIAIGIASQLVKGYYETGGNSKPGAYLLRSSGVFHHPTGQLGTGGGRTWTTGDLIGLAVDLESTTKTITFYKNGGVIYSHTVDESQGPFKFAAGTDSGSSNNYLFQFNFGQKPFKFLPSGGFLPLSASTVRPDNVISHPDQYVKANIYKGNGSSRSINVGFRPDMIWVKDRTQATHNNNLIDSLNGAPNIIVPDNAGTTLITNTTDGLTAITDTGFDLGANTGGTQSYELNKNGNNYVAWTWRAGGAPTATNSQSSGAMTANSVSLDGVLQSAYTPSGSPSVYPNKMSIGTKQGFSIVQWEMGGSQTETIPHGLSGIPSFYIIKNVDAGDNYVTYSTNIDGSLDYVFNYGTDGFSNSSRAFPTTSKVEFSSNSAGTHIMYCWHDVPGLHKTGTYKGFDSSNGPVIDLGFRPAIILLKKLTNTDSNSGWHWYDNKRNTSNPANNFLLAGHAYYENRAANNTADVSSYTVDFTSNGFRMSHGSNNLNNTNETYFYAAWAEAPAFNLYGAQSNAR